ncbi:MAG: hypothetical protein KA716_11940 [Gloeotrichia echinulata DEX184]|nr:hypothetical protein [Gloeotrichia echinulata DEX184]
MTKKRGFFVSDKSKALAKRGSLLLSSSFFTLIFSSLCNSTFAATPGCATSGQSPVSTSYLRQIATYRGIINNSMSTLTQNRRIGRSFQEFVQRSMAYPNENWYLFASPARQAQSGVASVRPDFTERVTNLDAAGNVRSDDQGSFVEVKATGAVLNLSYYRYQILGHIDAVSRRPAARFGRGAARVLFITTSDTTASPPDTIAEANRLGIGIWKAIVCTTAQPGGLLQVGPAVPLNPEIYAPNIPSPVSPGVLNDLALPGTAPAGLEDAEGGY